jgi:hypothetical protein
MAWITGLEYLLLSVVVLVGYLAYTRHIRRTRKARRQARYRAALHTGMSLPCRHTCTGVTAIPAPCSFCGIFRQ